MKTTEGRKGWMVEREETAARTAGMKRTTHGRKGNFHIERLHDAVWEGY